MDFSSFKTWRNIILFVLAIIYIVTKFSPSNNESNLESSSNSNSLCGTYVSYPNLDRRITRTYILNNNGSATVTFKSVTDFSNRTETETETYYGYWEKGSGYITVIYDNNGRTHQSYLDLSEKKVYSGYRGYRSRKGGVEFKKTN